jgi:putative flavoprotein involved in K+ transport
MKTNTTELIEEGAAFRELGGLEAAARAKAKAPRGREHFDVVIVGAGQAGLSVGYHLAQRGRGLRFVILDAEQRIGDVWRRRWDSLRLFTPARFDSLDGMPFPAPPSYFPTKDEMADYLEAYAKRFALPVRGGCRVDKLWKQGGRYVLRAGDAEIEADQVVIAMASYQGGRVPAFASELSPDIVQLHSSQYRRPGQLRDGAVLLAGAGNSGAEIAVDVARGRRVLMSGRDTGHVPFRLGGLLGRLLLTRLVLRVFFHRVLTVRTKIGRKRRPKMLHAGAPLIRTRPQELAAAGVERVARVVGVRDGKPLLADGRILDVNNVVWCTGYHPGLSWVDLPIFDDQGEPLHEEGVVKSQPGLYFVGLHFLFAMSSTMIHGVGRDAARIVDAAVSRARAVAPRAQNATASAA